MSPKANYPKKLTGSLNNLRKQNELCDVTIHVSKKSFPAHRAVLAAASSYFGAMFTSGFRERTDQDVTIDGDPGIFEELLNYAYTGHMKITSKTACCLLEMACYLQFTDICQYCPEFIHLSSSLKITDMLKMYDLATSHEYLGMNTLALAIIKHICSNVRELKSSKEFLETADVSFLMFLLSQDYLSSEEDVLEMVICWLKCGLVTRRPHAICLLKKVRLGLVPEDRLTELINDDIMDIQECQQLLQKVVKELNSDDSKIERVLNHPALFSRRGTITAPITLIRPPGWRTDDPFIFKYFDFDKKEWKEIPEFETPPFQTSLIVANDTLYSIGSFGKVGCEFTGDYFPFFPSPHQCRKYSAWYNQWYKMPCMEIVNGHSLSVLTDDFIYQIGGVKDREDKVVRFEIAEETWEWSAPLPERFTKCTSATVYQGSIVVYGVRNDSPRTHVIFSFNPRTNIWQTVMRDEVHFDEGKGINPTLFRQAGQVYRILYNVNESEIFRNDPVVNILELQSTENGITHVSVGQEVKQDLIPATSVGAFRIQDQVFVNVNECVLFTQLKITQNQEKDVLRELLEVFEVESSFEDLDSSNIVNFTFEKKVCINYESKEEESDSDCDRVNSDDAFDDDDDEEQEEDDEDDEGNGGEDDDNDDDNKMMVKR